MDFKPRNRTRKFKKTEYSKSYKVISPGMRGGLTAVDACKSVDNTVSDFDHPDKIKDYFFGDEKDVNRFKFIYGIGVILKFKESEMNDNIKSIEREIEKLNEEYVKNEKNYEDLIGSSNSGSASEMKEKLQESVREQLNKAYESKFSDLLIKKQAYDVVIKGLINRRWYIMKELQETKEGEEQGANIFKRIQESAESIYNLYRGPKYRDIRSDLYGLLKTISTNPALFRGSFALNSSIVGPAGSGKTTMAREIAKWYAALGILTYDAFYEDKKFKLSLTEVSRADLIGEYTGQTAPRTLGVLAKSLEKTLFIDEAYSVSGCSFDPDGKVQADAYGEEFLATMLLFMNNHKGYSSLIVAGYENQMEKCFFARNEGLPRRFPNKIVLPFYATDELFGIFIMNAKKKLMTAIVDFTDDVNEKFKKLTPEEQADADKLPVNFNTKAVAEYNLEVSSYYKFRYLTVMKPSFLMVHNDTTYDAVEILRKYLISIQLRILLTNKGSQEATTLVNLKKGISVADVPVTGGNSTLRRAASEPSGISGPPTLALRRANTNVPSTPSSVKSDDGSISLDNIYSYTIIAQVLINLFEPDTKSARKQLFKRLFYRDIFNFDSQNMSFFPAQAGEMENLADKCVLTVGDKIKDDVDKQIVIGFCDEAEVMNAFLVNKKLQVELYKEGVFVQSDAPRARAGMAGGASVLPSAGTPTGRRSPVAAAAAASSSGDPGAPASSASSVPDEIPDFRKKYFLELNSYNSELTEVQKRIHKCMELNELYGKCIPSLKELYISLFNPTEMTRLTTFMINLYLKKVSGDYLSGLINMPENEFPIHIVRKNLEQEIIDLQYINKYKPSQTSFDKPIKTRDLDELKDIQRSIEDLETDPDFEDLQEKAAEQKRKVIDKAVKYNADLMVGKKVSLRHPKLTDFKIDNQNLILKGDVLYGDFAFGDKVNNKVDTIPVLEGTNNFTLGFLNSIEPRLFALEKIAVIAESTKESVVEARTHAFEEATEKLTTLDAVSDKGVVGPLCKIKPAPAAAHKTLRNYKTATNAKLAEVREQPENIDELRRLRKAAEIQAQAKNEVRSRRRPAGNEE